MTNCQSGDVIVKNGQYGVVKRTKVLGTTDGYILQCFDGPMDTYPNKCAIFGFDGWAIAPSNITGTIGITSGTNQIIGTNTMFTSQMTPGNKLIVCDKQVVVDTVSSDTSLTLAEIYTGNTLINANTWNISI